MSVPLHNSVRTEGTDVYCRVVPVKRLRRTENVRGTFEGVSAPRECGQPSPLPAHRTPYGSRHFRELEEKSPGSLVLCRLRYSTKKAALLPLPSLIDAFLGCIVGFDGFGLDDGGGVSALVVLGLGGDGAGNVTGTEPEGGSECG